MNEKAVKDAISKILADTASYPKSLNYAVAYCQVAMHMSGETLRFQIPYILNNITGWRHTDAKDVRAILRREYATT